MPFSAFRFIAVVVALVLLSMGSLSRADEPKSAPAEHKHRIIGLFMPDREHDLRKVVESIPDIAFISVDFANSEATFRYDAAKVFPGAKPEQVVERLDNLLKQASRSTFGAKPLRTTPEDKLARVEIRVSGLDCKACSFAAYKIVAEIDGVEQATASFREGLITAVINIDKTNAAALEGKLKERGVKLVEAAK